MIWYDGGKSYLLKYRVFKYSVSFLYCVIISNRETALFLQIDGHRDFLCSEQLRLFHFSQTLLDPVSAVYFYFKYAIFSLESIQNAFTALQNMAIP